MTKAYCLMWSQTDGDILLGVFSTEDIALASRKVMRRKLHKGEKRSLKWREESAITHDRQWTKEKRTQAREWAAHEIKSIRVSTYDLDELVKLSWLDNDDDD